MKQIPFGLPMIGDEEKEAVMQVLNGPILTHGPRVKDFEASFAAYTGAPHALALSSCAAALHLSYFYLGIKPGDEVIVPAQTHVATAHAVELCGGKPIFIDAEPLTGNIDISQIERAVTPRTKAISIVHYLGRPVDMRRVMAIARKHNLFVVEDCALAPGTLLDGIHAGLWGDVGCFSFYPVKHITTGEGGMLITKHKKVADKISCLRAFGIDRHVVSERKIPGTYDVQDLGLNYRMSEISAALGIEQMKKLPAFIQKRQANYRALAHGLQKIEGVTVLDSDSRDGTSNYYCLMMLLSDRLKDQRYEIMDGLKQKGIGTSIYYPQAVPDMSYYRNKYGYKAGEFKEAARISTNGIALPVGPHLTTEDMAAIVNAMIDVLSQRSAAVA